MISEITALESIGYRTYRFWHLHCKSNDLVSMKGMMGPTISSVSTESAAERKVTYERYKRPKELTG